MRHNVRIGSDPVRFGLVTSLARPSGNGTGITQLSVEIVAKRIELAHELVPTATAFTTFLQMRSGVLVIATDVFFNGHVELLAALAIRHLVPAIYAYRQFVTAGGLISYGPELTDSYRLAGIYTGRILKGEKPADPPVQQATRVELIINLKTAKALGLIIPPALLATADEVRAARDSFCQCGFSRRHPWPGVRTSAH
jgi:putative ABC transport system substrate-binding protein